MKRTGRRRFRGAAEQGFAAAAVSPAGPVDHSAWILGGLWPPELQPVTAETAAAAEQLDSRLRSIAAEANDRMWELKRADLGRPEFGPEELRVLNVARARAVLLVEETVRRLRGEDRPPWSSS